MLPALEIKLKLKNVLHFEKVQRQLGILSRVAIDTKQDYNSAIHSVTLQLKLPKHLKNDAVRHQIAAHMVEDYNFYYPKMQKYLNAHNLSYSAYILYLYSGIIWADEYMLRALGRMFDVKISVVSPAYNDVWNIFHESGLPHVVIVANRGDFGKKHGVTHFCTTKGSETTWKCVCADINVGELGMWRGYNNGLGRTAAKFIEKEKMILLSNTHKVSADVQGLCHDLNQLCIRRDRIYSEMDSMGIKVDAFKRFDTFIYKRADSKGETEDVHKKSSGKNKKSKESKSEKRSSRVCGKFPKEVRERVLGDAVAELDKQKEGTEVPEQLAIDEVLRSRPGGCRIKNARKPFVPGIQVQVQVEVHETAKKGKQTSLAQFFAQPSTSKQRKHIEIKTKESVINITGAQKELPNITAEPRSKTKEKESSPAERSVLQKPLKRNTKEVIADVTGGEAPVKKRRAQTKSKGKQQRKASTGREIKKIIVFVTQNVDTSEVEPPVPEGERESHILYCDRCSFCTPDKRYFKKHNTWQCPLLTVVERLKCPEEGCESLFIHENSH